MKVLDPENVLLPEKRPSSTALMKRLQARYLVKRLNDVIAHKKIINDVIILFFFLFFLLKHYVYGSCPILNTHRLILVPRGT